MTKKLFMVQDDDAPLYVVAENYSEAIHKWKRWIVDQSEGQETMLDPNLFPKGIQFIADQNELLL